MPLPFQQINKGHEYGPSGEPARVTHSNLNEHVDNATLLVGAVTAQTANALTEQTDTFLVAKNTSLVKQTKETITDVMTSSQFTLAGVALHPLVHSFVPTGAVMPFAMATAPAYWAICDGSTHNTTEESGKYAAIYAVIGITYGGTGATSFRLPDLRGEFVRGWDNGRGVDTSRAIGTSQTQQLQKHKHISSNNDCQNYAAINGTGTGNYNSFCDTDGYVTNTAGASLTGDGTHTEQTANLGTETRPRNIALNYCIKL